MTKVRIVAESDHKKAEDEVNKVLEEMDKEHDLVNILPVTPSGTLGPWKFILYFQTREKEAPFEEDSSTSEPLEFMRPPIES